MLMYFGGAAADSVAALAGVTFLTQITRDPTSASALDSCSTGRGTLIHSRRESRCHGVASSSIASLRSKAVWAQFILSTRRLAIALTSMGFMRLTSKAFSLYRLGYPPMCLRGGGSAVAPKLSGL